jgi:nucleotide-binding universal stress UspA family protein
MIFRKILAAYDGSEGAKAALERAFTAAKEYGASIAVVWVRGLLPHHAISIGEVEDEKEAADEFFSKLKSHAEQRAAEKGLPVQCICLKGKAAHEIVNYAEANGFDLIVIGQVGHSDFIGRVLGPTADRISETAHCDVLIVRRPGSK